MRKVGTLVGLTLSALAATAGAQEAAPATPPASEVTAPAATDATPPAAPAVADAPAKANEAASAVPPESAGDVPATATATTPSALPPSKFHLGLTFLPVALGEFTATAGGQTSTSDMAFAYGLGLSANYTVLAGLSVGFAPQVLFNIQPKENSPGAAKEIDVMLRIAYTHTLVDSIALYAEVLPGYSLIQPPGGDAAKGYVLAFGAGCMMDVTEKIYATLGVGTQRGYQKRPAEGGVQPEANTKFLRVVLGGGVRF